MSRFSFGVFGQDTTELLAGLEINVKDNTNTIVASTSPSGSELQITDNNDGTYFVDGLSSGIYSVYVGSSQVAQEELQNIVFVNEDVTNHLSAQTGVHGATGQTLGRGDVKDNLVSTDTDKPLSAAQGKALQDGKASQSSVDAHTVATSGVHGAAGQTLGRGDVVDDLISTDTDLPLSAKQGKALQDSKVVESVDSVDFEVNGGALALKDQGSGLTDENYAKSVNSIYKNLDILDQQLKAIAEAQGGIDRRVVFADETEETGSGLDASALPTYSETGTALKVKKRVIYRKRSGDTKLILTFQGSKSVV